MTATVRQVVDDPGSRSTPSGGFRYRPGLDGLRGIAVIGVLLFHSGFSWAVGGYLGVSAFFTLSGFLISTLLILERDHAGFVDLRAFWTRRFRRLLPPALATVALALAFVLAVGDETMADRFRGDALAALGYVANWRFIVSDLSYAELFTEESPLQHMWSLAIEEQFYLALPLVAVVAFRSGNVVRRLALIAVAGVAASVAVTLLLGQEAGDRLYYGTDARAAELLVGVALACAYHRWDLLAAAGRHVRWGLGVAGLVAITWMWSTVEQTSAWLHPWALLAHAALSAVVIVAACDDRGVGRVLSTAPLVELGKISYGVYLYHWPIFLWLSPARTGLDTVPLFIARCSLTLVVALLSHRLLEMPIRHRRLSFGGHGGLVTAGSMASVALLVVGATMAVDRGPAVDIDAAQELADSLADVPAAGETTDAPRRRAPVSQAPPEAEVTWTPPADRPPRLSIFGDSTALLLIPGLVTWSEPTGMLQVVEGMAAPGCGLGRGGLRRGKDGRMEPVFDGCSFSENWVDALERAQPEIALVQVGMWDLVDRQLPGDDELRTIGDPVYDEYLASELRAAATFMLERVERVVWVLQPPPVSTTRDPGDPVADRLDQLNEMLIEVFADHPEVGLVDLAGWLDEAGSTESLRLRPDGTHFSDSTSTEAATWLGPALLRAAATATVVEPDDVDPVPVPSA